MKVPRSLGEWTYWRLKGLRGQADIQQRLNWLLETQHWSPEQLAELQALKLRATIEHAFHTVPYYKETMQELGLSPEDIQSPADLVKLPLLTRAILNKQRDRLISTEADLSTLYRNYSSGSTGVRAEFYQDLDFSMWMRAHQLRTYGWCDGWRLGEPFALLWGSEIYWSSKRWMENLENLITNRREFNTFRLSDDLIRHFLESLLRFRPVLVSTYTNAMHLIAREAERRQVRIPEIRCIQGTSEPLPPPVRQRLRKIFDCEVYDKYGSRETNIVSHESPRHEHNLIQVENVVVEFMNENGHPCVDGETGRVVLTTLNNMSMPLIRYETSDLAAPLSGFCSSGLGLPRMSTVAGRLQDLIVTPRRDYIDSYIFSYLLMRFDAIHWFQVVQDRVDAILLRVFVPGGLSCQEREEIVQRIQHHASYPMKVEFECLDAMPPSSTGKFRLCVSNLGIGDSPTSMQPAGES